MVDDNIDNLRLLTDILTQAGYQVRSAEKPRLALESALAFPPALILLDVMMPEMDGFEVCQHLKTHEHTREVPIIFISALHNVADKVRGFEAGGVDFISKPFQKLEVLARVKTHLQLRTMQLYLEALVTERTTELRESEKKYRTVVEEAVEGILVIQDGRRKYYNPAWLEMTGYSAEEYDPMPFPSLMHADDLASVEKNYQNMMTGQHFEPTLDFRITTKSGDIKWLSIRNSKIDWENEPAVMIFINNITERIRTEQALRESEEEFRQLMEQSPISIQLLAPDGKITKVNRAFMDLWGISEDELPDLIAQYNVLEDDEARKHGLMPLIEKAFQGEAVILPVIEYDGANTMDSFGVNIAANKVWIQARLYPVKNLDGDIVGVVDMEENVTDRKQAEQKIQESEERFRATFEQAAVGIAHVAPDGVFLRINQKFCDIVGYSHTEMEKLTFQEITHPDDLDNDLQQVERLLTGNLDFYSLEKRYYHKNGKIVWINLTVSLLRKATGEPDYFVAVIEDISDRKVVELALNESEIKYRSLVEQAMDAIIVIQDDVIKFANTRFAEITGYTFEGLQSTPFTRYLPAEERPILLEMYQHRHDEETPSMVESVIMHKNGSRIEVELNSDITTYEGKPAVLVFIRDITNRKQREREIQIYQKQLKALASQLTLTEEQERRRIAAELHDHVGQALAFTRMQVAAAQKAQTEARRSEILEEASETLKETIQETRSLVFDLSSPLMNELGLNAAITEWLQERVEKRAGLKTEFIEIGPDIPMPEDVRAILFRNLRELLSNVIRHAQATSVRVTLEQTNTQTRIIVEDDGVGFDPEKVSPTVTRTGSFGLFSIKERMNDMGGSIEINSAPGKGSIITLALPSQAV